MLFVSLTAAASPSFTVVGISSPRNKYKIMVNYNGQADLLLSLQIFPDYYPYQFKQRKLYDYLTNINKYLVVNDKTSSKKKEFSFKIQSRLDNLVGKVTAFGPSLWNEDLYEGGLVHRNEQFWTSKETDYLFLEQFIADDYADPLFLVNKLPKHKHVIITNFRASRDPYTLFNEEVYSSFSNSIGTSASPNKNNQKLSADLKKYYKSYSQLFPNNLYRAARYIEFWNSFCSMLKETLNKQSDGNKENVFFKLPTQEEKIFVPFSNNDSDEKLAKLFESLIFEEDEIAELKKWLKEGNQDSRDLTGSHLIDYLRKNKAVSKSPSICPSSSGDIQKVHHPALEHQTIKGSSPTSEGTQKDLMVYLAQIAISLQKVSEMNSFNSDFGNDVRKEFIKNAFNNSLKIAKNYKERLKKIRDYFKSAHIVDSKFDPEANCFERSNSKIVAVISFPPSQLGAGNSAIQTISKYPFLYTELGLKEVLPKELSPALQVSAHSHDTVSEDILGLDDNGWWWRLGDSNFSYNGFESFQSSIDSIIFLATKDDWNILNMEDNPKLYSLRNLLKDKNSIGSKLSYSSYHLWNEGLRSPLTLNLLLDTVVETLTKQFEVNLDNSNDLSKKYEEAMDWGDYWEQQFVNSQAIVK